MLFLGVTPGLVAAGTLSVCEVAVLKEERLRTSIADYEVIGPAMAGPAGGARYLCRPPGRLDLDAPVTVTELAVDAAGWQQLADFVVRLANVAASGVLQLLEIGPDVSPERAGVYLATETATGGSLSDPVGDVDQAARLGAMVVAARAAHAMHEAGLPHGSISPARVLLTDRGPVLGPPRLDAPPGVAATFSHWSELVAVDPDVLAGEHPSRSSDIWALGAALHTVLSRRPLYPGIEEDEPVTAVQRVIFTRPEIDPALAAGPADIVKACLERDPAGRPQTALEVAERLAGGAA